MTSTYCRTELIGRLGQDPEFRYLESGRALARLRVATDRPSRNGAEPASLDTERILELYRKMNAIRFFEDAAQRGKQGEGLERVGQATETVGDHVLISWWSRGVPAMR